MHIDDMRRAHNMDSGLRSVCAAFSVHATLKNSKGSGHLMAAADLEAVVVLSCLRAILEPERAWQSLEEAIHFPADALRVLEGGTKSLTITTQHTLSCGA